MKIFDLTGKFLRLIVKDINTNCPSNDEYKLCDQTIGDELFNCIIGKAISYRLYGQYSMVHTI